MKPEAGGDIGSAFDAMLRQYYTPELVAEMLRPSLFSVMREQLPKPTRWQRFRWRVRRVAQWPFARLAYAFAWLGGVSFDRDEY